jgi:hypothetical protein
MGADVVNMSFGAPAWSALERRAIARAGAAGVLTVAAAGNQARDNDALRWSAGEAIPPSYPASYDLPALVSVAASNDRDEYGYETGCAAANGGDPEPCFFTNWGGESVDLVAPGVDVVGTWLGGTSVVASGTSMAAPFVAGVAALVASLHPAYGPEELRAALLNGADRPSSLAGFATLTDGRVNADAALVANPRFDLEPSDGTLEGAKLLGLQHSGRLRAIEDVNDVYRRRLVEGERYSVELDVPAGSDFDLYVWEPGTKDLWPVDGGCGFSCALAARGVRGAGTDEAFVLEPISTGWYWFVVTVRKGSGSYTLRVAQ